MVSIFQARKAVAAVLIFRYADDDGKLLSGQAFWPSGGSGKIRLVSGLQKKRRVVRTQPAVLICDLHGVSSGMKLEAPLAMQVEAAQDPVCIAGGGHHDVR